MPDDDADIPPDDPTPPARAEPHLYTLLPLAQVRAHAEAMTNVGVPGHLCDQSPPDAFVTMTVLQSWLFAERTPVAETDAVWRYLIDNANAHGEQWQVFTVAVAASELMRYAYFLTPGGDNGYPDDKRHVQQHLIVAFLVEILRVTDDDERIGRRAIWRAAWRAKQEWWFNREMPWPLLPGQKPEPEPVLPDATPPPDDELPYVLPDLVARTADVAPSRTDRRPQVTARDATLIALCTLYGRTIAEAATEIGISESAAKSRIPEVKRAIFDLLASPYLKNRRPEWSRDPKVRRQHRPRDDKAA